VWFAFFLTVATIFPIRCNTQYKAKTAVEKPDEHLMMMHHLFQMCILQTFWWE